MTEFVSKFNSIDSNLTQEKKKRKKRKNKEREKRVCSKDLKPGRLRFHLVNKSSDLRDLKKSNTVASPLLHTLKMSMQAISSSPQSEGESVFDYSMHTRQQRINSLRSSFIYSIKKEPKCPENIKIVKVQTTKVPRANIPTRPA